MVQFVHVRFVCCLCEAVGAKTFSDPFAFVHILLVMLQPCTQIKKSSQQSTNRTVSRHRSASSFQSWKNSQDSYKSVLPSPTVAKSVLTDVSKNLKATGAVILPAERREFLRFQRSERICRKRLIVPPIQVWKNGLNMKRSETFHGLTCTPLTVPRVITVSLPSK